MFVTAIVQSFMLQYYFHYCYLLGMKVKTALLGLIYEKVIQKHGIHIGISSFLKQTPQRLSLKLKLAFCAILKNAELDVMLLLQSLASFYSRIHSYTHLFI